MRKNHITNALLIACIILLGLIFYKVCKIKEQQDTIEANLRAALPELLK